MLKIFGVVLLAIFFSQTLKHFRPDNSVYIGLSCSLLLLLIGVGEISPFISYFSSLVEKTEYMEYFSLITKALGTALVCESTCQMCKDMGELQISSKVEFIGKCEIMLLSLPLIKDVVAVLGENLL
ncbi:MAG: hypothetical protein E7623_07120 [Ruminococcaceae bacterium]|nr:hypothetical protein [Oscillospiraceae bacterium]